jgi:hypothetical protein
LKGSFGGVLTPLFAAAASTYGREFAVNPSQHPVHRKHPRSTAPIFSHALCQNGRRSCKNALDRLG